MRESAHGPHERYCSYCDAARGNSVPIDCRRKDECEIRADIPVKKERGVRVWGRVKSYENEPVEGALVKLLRLEQYGGRSQLVGVAHTITDCKGFYQFEIPESEKCADYRVIAGKPAVGRERVITGHGCCAN